MLDAFAYRRLAAEVRGLRKETARVASALELLLKLQCMKEGVTVSFLRGVPEPKEVYEEKPPPANAPIPDTRITDEELAALEREERAREEATGMPAGYEGLLSILSGKKARADDE